MSCKYFDCGWCYAPSDVVTTDKNGQCNLMAACPQSFDEQGREAVEKIYGERAPIIWPEPNLPPVNLDNSLSADNFYPDVTYNPSDDSEEHW